MRTTPLILSKTIFSYAKLLETYRQKSLWKVIPLYFVSFRRSYFCLKISLLPCSFPVFKIVDPLRAKVTFREWKRKDKGRVYFCFIIINISYLVIYIFYKYLYILKGFLFNSSFISWDFLSKAKNACVSGILFCPVLLSSPLGHSTVGDNWSFLLCNKYLMPCRKLDFFKFLVSPFIRQIWK